MGDLSLKGAVEEMKCHFKGCMACIYQLEPYKGKGCIEIGGASALYSLQKIGRVFGQELKRIPQLLNNELEEIVTEDEDYSIINLEQMKELIDIARPFFARFETFFTDSHLDITDEWRDKVAKEFDSLPNSCLRPFGLCVVT
jgi:hypothetical protein